MEAANKRHKMSLCSHLESTHFTPPKAHHSVYKDECCACFFSQDDTRGIDVCLDCFHAGCLEPGREHAYGHYTLTRHAVALNIQRREKSRKEAPVTKIAVAAETDADRYSYETSLRCYACSFETNETPSALGSVVDGIMNALSTIQQSEVKAWEQEMTACEHTLTLQQEPAKTLADSSLATCSDCSLSENLWLCLVCGKLSCGRQQFGGGGGNGHGLQHVDASGHGLAVKLGSITPEGTADVYCYTCDEERLDPMLADHLAHWGILLHGRVKTEKSLQELQVEQNLKWDFSMQTDDGKDMTPLFGPGLTGLKNIGNSCYLASILQCLFALPAFSERFLTPFQQDPIDIVREPAADLEVQMRKMADGLLSGLFSTPHQHGNVQVQHGIAPTLFKNLVGKGHPEFSTMRQQDAMEFLLHLCNQLETLQAPAGLSNPTDAFKFCTEQRTQCRACKRVAYKTERQEHVSILVPARRLPGSDAYAPVSMETLLDLYTAEEHVDWTCPACTAKEGATKSTRFKTFPAVLVLNPGRFALENWVPAKLEIPIVMPTTLSLDKYRATGLQPDEDSLPDDADATSTATATANEEHVEMLMSMGFPRVRSEKALLTTGAGTEAAMEWLFAHMDDADIDEPYKPPASGKQEANAALVGDLTEMGFPKHLAIKGLLATGNADVQAALEWVIQHMDDPETEDIPQMETVQVQEEQDTRPAEYTCRALVCHKGTSVHAGHYIAYVKRALGQGADEDWVLMNDEKVVRGVAWEEAARTGYVYFMERKT